MTHLKRPIEDTMAAMVCHGALTRHPDLRISCIENGGNWVVPFLEHLAEALRMMPQGFDEDPIEAFRRCISVNPFHEDDLQGLIDAVGVDNILFGSDFPHPEGLAEPCSYVDRLPEGTSDEDVAKIMGGNLARLMRVDAPVAA
jgi:predicted TIM-barrel fold metal-dependent hydrolase